LPQVKPAKLAPKMARSAVPAAREVGFPSTRARSRATTSTRRWWPWRWGWWGTTR